MTNKQFYENVDKIIDMLLAIFREKPNTTNIDWGIVNDVCFELDNRLKEADNGGTN